MNTTDDECWICDRHILTLIMWSAKLPGQHHSQVDNYKKLQVPLTQTNPLIAGSFTNWKPIQMTDALEYCEQIRTDKVNQQRYIASLTSLKSPMAFVEKERPKS
jgi:hypothetical protein